MTLTSMTLPFHAPLTPTVPILLTTRVSSRIRALTRNASHAIQSSSSTIAHTSTQLISFPRPRRNANSVAIHNETGHRKVTTALLAVARSLPPPSWRCCRLARSLLPTTSHRPPAGIWLARSPPSLPSLLVSWCCCRLARSLLPTIQPPAIGRHLMMMILSANPGSVLCASSSAPPAPKYAE